MKLFTTIVGSTLAVMFFVMAPCHAEEPLTGNIKRNDALFRFTYENLNLPQSERMGLVGGDYLLAVKPWFLFGLGAFGAVNGNRGGFFTGGFEADVRKQLIEKVSIQAGVFLGGGGGSSAPQGGGLMVRPHGELLYDTGLGAIGAGISHIRFPNGNISSTQVSFSYENSLNVLLADGWLEGKSLARSVAALELEHPLSNSYREYSIFSALYFPAQGTKNSISNKPEGTIGVTGIELRHFFDQEFFIQLNAAGAVAGKADGFAQVLLGGGWRYPLPARSAFTTNLSVGAAGGGSINTGGGVVTSIDAGFRHWLWERWSAGLSGGYIFAPDGDFRATTVGVNIAYGIEPLQKQPAEQTWYPGWWQIRSGCQVYIPAGRIRKSENDRDSVDLFAVKFDRMFSENSYLSGQALGAFNGNAGGYAAGLLGGGWTAPLWTDSQLYANAEMLLGAGGGGNISTGGGFLLQPMAGIGWMFTRQTGILLSGGVVAALEGRLMTAIADLSLVYRFTTAERQ